MSCLSLIEIGTHELSFFDVAHDVVKLELKLLLLLFEI